jgi:tetratricopeptide (TPR) repeat protein
MLLMTRYKKAIGLFLLLAITTLVYLNHFHNGFHFDDHHTIVDNAYIRNLQNLPRFFRDGATSSTLVENQSYRPLVTTSLAIDYRLGNGYNPFFFQLSTFLLFLLQGVLMVLLFRQVLATTGSGSRTLYGAALLAAAAYLLHPAVAETVNYIIARSDVESTFFVVLAFVCYRQPFFRRTWLYLLPLLIGSLAKPSVVMFAPMLWCYSFLLEQQQSFTGLLRKDTRRQALLATRRSLPAFVCCALLYLFIDRMTPAGWKPGGTSAYHYLITQPYVILHYFRSFFLPTSLSADADWQVLSTPMDLRFAAGLGFLLLLAAAIVVTSSRPRWRPVSFGLLWFVLALVPTSSIIPLGEVMNDHRMYFPFVGLALAVVWAGVLACQALGRRSAGLQRLAIAAAIGALVLLAYGTFRRNQVWKTEDSLWYDVTQKSPGNGRGLMNYGLTRMAAGDYATAETYFNRALKLLPAYSYLHINLGILMNAKGDPQKAEPYFRKAIELSPALAQPYYHYGNFLVMNKRYAEAIPVLEKGLQYAPAFDGIIGQLLFAYETTGNWNKLQKLAEQATQLDPANTAYTLALAKARRRSGWLEDLAEQTARSRTPEQYLSLSLAYYQAGRFNECIAAARQATELKKDYAEAYNNIGAAYIALHDWSKAIAPLQQALALQPGYALAANNLAEAQKNLQTQARLSPAEQLVETSLQLFNQGDYNGCIRACNQALALRPGYSLAYNNLCAAYNQLKDWDQAIAAARKGLAADSTNQLLKNNLAVALQEKSRQP